MKNEFELLNNLCKCHKEQLQENEDVEPLPHSAMEKIDGGEMNAPGDDLAELQRAVEEDGGMLRSDLNVSPFKRETID